MKQRIVLLVLLLFSLPTSLSARPVSVTLYPQGAMVTEEDTFLAGKDIVLTLPAEGDAGSHPLRRLRAGITPQHKACALTCHGNTAEGT